MTLRRFIRFTSAAMVVGFVAGFVFASDTAPVDFNRDVRQIFTNKCFKCHGPDEATREAGLRLDVRDVAIAELDSGETAIVPGDSGASELLARVATDDADMRMPPADSKIAPLTKSEIDIIRRWIDEGAPYAKHWAFVTPTRPIVPLITAPRDWNNAAPIRNPIDADRKSTRSELQSQR